jgi:hypothetical protein
MGKRPMSDEPDAYQTYLLHLWRARYQGNWQWRASLESPRTGERQVFAGLQQLFAFVEERCDGQAGNKPEEGRRCFTRSDDFIGPQKGREP